MADAKYSLKIDGVGHVLFEGTNEFVQKMIRRGADCTKYLLEKYIQMKLDKGRDQDDIEYDFMCELRNAARRAGVEEDSLPPLPEGVEL